MSKLLERAKELQPELVADRRWLHIKLRYRGKTFFYQTENPKMAGAQTKKSGSRHGYGLKNIRRSVKKYSGQVVIVYRLDQIVQRIHRIAPDGILRHIGNKNDHNF